MTPVPAPQKSASTKPMAFVALLGLEDPANQLFRDSFKQFGIETSAFPLETAETRFKREKFEAAVLRLSPEVEPLLKFLRSNPETQRMVLYGICATAQQALRYSQYGVNAVFNDPIDRQNLLRVIRSTHLLVLHELRRYVRIPMLAEVNVSLSTGRTRTTMLEVSGGGMSMQSSANVKQGEPVEVSFSLPGTKEIALAGTIAWVRPEQGTIGVRFNAQEPNRSVVKAWIDDYLDVD